MRNILLLMVATAGCGGGGKLSAAERDELAGCTESMEVVAAGGPDGQAARFAAGCGAQVPGLADYANADSSQRLVPLAEKSDLVCAAAAEKIGGAEAGDRWRLLIELCGADRYGLTAAQGPLFSIEWFVVQRAAARAATLRGRSSGEAAEQFDRAAAALTIQLPLPVTAAGVYQLPRADRKDLASPRAYVVVRADGLRVGVAPVARLSRDGARLEFPAGEPFPGAAVPAAELDARVTALLGPPPPADDEDGGTGTAPNFEEGKMGKKESEREEGRYKMPAPTDPQLARKQAIERARTEGILAAGRAGASRAVNLVLLADAAVPAERLLEAARLVAGRHPRVGVQGGFDIAAQTVAFEPVPPPPPASPGTIGTGRYGTLGHGSGTGSGYGTGTGGGSGSGYAPRPPRPAGEFRVHVILGAGGVIIADSFGERQLLPYRQGGPDFDALSEALRKLRDQVPDYRLVISAAPGPTVQALVGVLDVAAGTGARTVGAAAPDAAVFAAPTGWGSGPPVSGPSSRNPNRPRILIGAATLTGDLDKNVIRRYIRRHQARVLYCYEKQLAIKPGLQGTVVTSFVIRGDGTVSGAQAGGVSPEVSGCIADVLSSIVFPKPKGGGLVQVRYPFELRPTAAD